MQRGVLMIETDYQAKNESVQDYPELYSNTKLTRSNQIIFAKYKGSLIESKIIALSMSRLAESGHDNTIDGRTVSFSTEEIRTIIGLKDNSFIYEQLKITASNLLDHKFYIEDPANKQWAFFVLFDRAAYINGSFVVTMSASSMQFFREVTTSFTTMDLPILMSFGQSKYALKHNNYAFRLYEILRVYKYRITRDRPVFKCRWNVADLRVTIGAISDDKLLRELLGRRSTNNMTAIFDEYSSKTTIPHQRYTDFERRVLKKCRDEINANTDIYINYQEKRSGRGGKVTELIFSISENPGYKNPDKKDAPDEVLVEKALEIIGKPLKRKTVLRLLSAAGNDLGKIENAVNVANAQKKEIRNLGGFLRRAIEEEWAIEDTISSAIPLEKGLMYSIAEVEREKIKKTRKNTSSYQKNPFNQFEQNTYDFEQLEMDILSNNV